MKVIKGYPPNWNRIRAAFPEAARHSGVLFCYGDTIYRPSGQPIPPEIVAHEEVHSRQQAGDPESWWSRYIADPKFRFDQELEAHVAEVRVAVAGAARPRRRAIIREIATRLSSALYGNVVTYEQAVELLTPEPVGAGGP